MFYYSTGFSYYAQMEFEMAISLELNPNSTIFLKNFIHVFGTIMNYISHLSRQNELVYIMPNHQNDLVLIELNK